MKTLSIISICLVSIALLTSAHPTYAVAVRTTAPHTTTPAAAKTVSVTPAEKMNQGAQSATDIKVRGDAAIATRLAAIDRAVVKIQNSKRLTAAQKSSLISSYQTVATNLKKLQTKIDGESDVTMLKEDVASISKNYRIYQLVVPQASIIANSERIGDLIANFQTVITKLDTRIVADQKAGKNVAALQTSLADIKAKLADAQTKASAGYSAVNGLLPDNGDTAKQASNKQAIALGHSNIKTARDDIKAAHTDAKTIVAGLKALK